MAPAFLMLAAFILYPMIMNIITSLQIYDLTLIDRSYVGMQNYQRILGDRRIWAAIERTFIWTSINLVFMLIIGMSTALLLSTGFRGNTVIKSIMLIPWILPSVITGYSWSLMLNEDAGIVTWIMKSTGLVSQGFSWFQSGNLSMTAAIMANIWRGFPFFALMIYAKIMSLPTDHVEAAALEGANHRQMFIYITFPYIKPVVAACTFLAFIWTFNAYDILRVMTGGGPAELTTTMPLLIQKEAFQFYSLSNAATMSVIMFFLMLLIIFAAVAVSYYLRKRKSRSYVKKK